MGTLTAVQRRNQFPRLKTGAATMRTIFAQPGERVPVDSTGLALKVLRNPALADLVGFDSSIEHGPCAARQEYLMTPLAFKISTTRSDHEKGDDEPLAFIDLHNKARRPPERPLPLPL